MRTLGGLVLLAGIGVGLFVYLPAPGDSSLSLETARRAGDAAREAHEMRVAESVAKAPVADARQVRADRSFAPGISLASLNRSSGGRSVKIVRPGPNGAVVDASGGWQAVVGTSGAVRPASSSLSPSSPQSRYELIVELQKQLKRLGCYYGRVDGSWGPGSKQAMRTFTQRVNAELPADDPNYMLLNLLEGQSGKTCTQQQQCPQGLTLSSSGQCTARPGYAQAPSAPEVLPWKQQQAAASPAAPPASTASAQPLFRPVTTSIVSSEPLPGRMSIGGPKNLPSVNSLDGSNGAYSPRGAGTAAPTATAFAEPTEAAAPRVSSPPKRQARSHSRRNRDPIRHNLMLSLGGAY